MNKKMIIIVNRCTRLIGNIFKILSYPFHFILPRLRFTIPTFSKAKYNIESSSTIPRTIWQTNYSNKCTLPVYLNYLFNRMMSLDFEYRYVSTEKREEFMRNEAPEDVYQAFTKLNDGAAQADLWRLTVLYLHGGVYMDIDATLVWPLRKLLAGENNALYIKIKNSTEYTNFFLATNKLNPHYKEIIDKVVHNINNYDSLDRQGVYCTTGPDALNFVLKDKQGVHFERRRYVCIQGTFTNEYFQYLDKPKGKWTHMKKEDLIKK